VASPKEERLAVLGIFMHINQFWQGWRGPRLPDTNRLAEKPGNIEARRPHGASDAARGHGVELLHRDIGLAGKLAGAAVILHACRWNSLWKLIDYSCSSDEPPPQSLCGLEYSR
jgi:hypothetical protein